MKRHYSIVRKGKECANRHLTDLDEIIRRGELGEIYSNSFLMLKCVTEDGLTCYASPGVFGWVRFMYFGFLYTVKKAIGLAE